MIEKPNISHPRIHIPTDGTKDDAQPFVIIRFDAHRCEICGHENETCLVIPSFTVDAQSHVCTTCLSKLGRAVLGRGS